MISDVFEKTMLKPMNDSPIRNQEYNTLSSPRVLNFNTTINLPPIQEKNEREFIRREFVEGSGAFIRTRQHKPILMN